MNISQHIIFSRKVLFVEKFEKVLFVEKIEV